MKRVVAVAMLILISLACVSKASAGSQQFVVAGGGRQAVVVGGNRQTVVVNNRLFGQRVVVAGGRQAVVVNNRPALFGRQTVVTNPAVGFNRLVVRVR